MKSKTLLMALLTAATTSLSSCIFEEPEMTDNGELGIDPTETTITTDITLDLTLPSAQAGDEPFLQPGSENTNYRRRTIITAVAEGLPPVSKTIISDISATDKELVINASLKLHARKYDIVVWCDYVYETAEKSDQGYFYNIDQLPNVFMSDTYRGCNDYKDSASACAELDLTSYRGEWNKRISLEMELERPVARLQLKANDVASFLKQHSDASYSVRISYPGYLCMGYNITEDLRRHALMYMKFEKTFKLSDLTAGEDYLLAFDYLLADKKKSTEIPVNVEILNSAKSQVLASTRFNAFCKAGTYNTVIYNFLTSQGGDGIDFDADFSGSQTIVIPAN